MIKIFVQRLAEETLQDLFERDYKQYLRIEAAIDEIAKKGLGASQIKKLSGTKNIFRKRVGRWRVLFTFEAEVIKIWIIAMEKGTSQDYFRWIFYIQKNV
jgi:mRNA-degrading endonuclease RelE of RelBE toxin-antitoxin system